MYIPELYKNENQEEVNAFLQQNSFGILVNRTNGKLWATHIPLELDTNENGKSILFGHISKENPQYSFSFPFPFLSTLPFFILPLSPLVILFEALK